MRTDKTAALAAERQEPFTAAEQAAADGHAAEFARDVPASCPCPWRWSRPGRRYILISQMTGCPWHGPLEGERS